MTGKRVAAFFDFDNTLLADDSVRLGVKYLYDNRMVSKSFVLGLLIRNFFYKRNLYSQQDMISYALLYYRGRNMTPLLEGSEKFYGDVIKPRLSRRVLGRLDWHRGRGHVPVIISASLRYLLAPVVKDLSIPHLICTDLEMGADGRPTGKAAGPICVGKNKAQVARDFAAANGIELASSYAYSDHHSDTPLLELVGNPVVVGPNEPLRRLAQARGWPIISHGNATEDSA